MEWLLAAWAGIATYIAYNRGREVEQWHNTSLRQAEEAQRISWVSDRILVSALFGGVDPDKFAAAYVIALARFAENDFEDEDDASEEEQMYAQKTLDDLRQRYRRKELADLVKATSREMKQRKADIGE